MHVLVNSAFVVVVCTLAPTVLAAPATPQCSDDPNWRDTLRCKFYPDLDQTPPLGPSNPTTANEVKDFTRVDLPWRNKESELLRCVDGTQPAIYVDEAEDSESDRWLFTFQGGGSCNDGASCLSAYMDPSEQGEMSTANDPAMKTFEGIHRPDAPNEFSDYHRVRIQKCNYDRYNGNATHKGVIALPEQTAAQRSTENPFSTLTDVALTFDLYHHGQKTVRHTLDHLRHGLQFPTWIAAGMEANEHIGTLPPLENASVILFAGHSGAAHGLMNNIDHINDYLHGWARDDGSMFSADVRALFDAQLLPSIESEAAFNEYLNADVYAHQTQCLSPMCEGGPPLHYHYDGKEYFSSGGVGGSAFFDGPYLEWNVQLDTSCLNANPTEQWRCADRFHVLYNHIATPFFIREDFTDPNGQHNNNPSGPVNNGHRLFWAKPEIRFCKDPESLEPCLPVLSAADFRARVEEQAEQLLSSFSTKAEQWSNGDGVPTVYIWAPDCGVHAGAFNDAQFFNVVIDDVNTGMNSTMHDFLVDFMNDQPTDSSDSRIDGNSDFQTTCP